jgi:hypothetical protein
MDRNVWKVSLWLMIWWGQDDYKIWTVVTRQKVKGKGKAVPLQAWSGPEGSRKLRFPYFMTPAQDGRDRMQ